MKKWGILAFVIVTFLIVGFAISLTISTSNCGGNSAALTYTSGAAAQISMALDETPKPGGQTLREIVPPDSWNAVFRFGWGVQSYWVLKKIEASESGPVIICAQCFGNVPQPAVWNLYRGNPAFAAGYLNAKAGLLTIHEFNSIDLHRYEYISKTDVEVVKIGSRVDRPGAGEPQQ